MATVILVDRAVGLFSMLLVVVLLAALQLAPVMLAPRPLHVIALVSLAALADHHGIRALSSAPPRSGDTHSTAAVHKVRALQLHPTTGLNAPSFIPRPSSRGTAGDPPLDRGTARPGSVFAAAGTVLVPEAPLLTTSLLSLLGLIANWIPLTPAGTGESVRPAFAGLFGYADTTAGAKSRWPGAVGMLPLAVVGDCSSCIRRAVPISWGILHHDDHVVDENA